ncbi:MAG: PBSX family phage terminase large subunit [Clostridia bacterium]|nr:PBSX family phage terminase large subunit [Clostridia bacterium]
MRYQKFSTRQILTLTWWNRPQFRDSDGIICDGSIRSGKTLSMADGFILWSMSCFNEQNFAICGKTIQSLRRNVITQLPKWLEGIFTVTEKRSENLLIIRAGDTVNRYYMFGGKDESSYALIQGVTLAGVYFDEVALMPRSFVEQAMGRCSIEGSKFWFNCNPDNPSHWFYVEWIKKAREHNLIYLHFTMKDNLSLSKKIRDRYESMFTGVFYRRYILGLWVKAEGLVYPMFDLNKHVISDMPPVNPRHRYYVSIDYGTVNPFAAGLYDYNPATQTATMIKELYYRGGSANRVDNEAYYKMLKNLIGDYGIQYIVIDPSASSMIETIQKYGDYLVVKADNDVLNGIQDTTKFLNLGHLFFHKDCKNTFDEFGAYSWNEDSVEDAVIKENDHSMDQLRYFCRTVLRSELKWIV